MVGQSGIVGADKGKQSPQRLAAAVVALALAACGAMQSKPAETPSAAVERVDPASKDALTAPGNESRGAEPPVSESAADESAAGKGPASEPPTPDLPATPAAPEPQLELSDPPPGAPQAQFEKLDGDNVLENTRETVRSSTVWLARGVDSWFGDRPFDAGTQLRDGRLSVGLSKRQEESLDARVRFNARVRLPNLEQRAYFFVGRDNEREVTADTPGAFSRQDRLLAETPQDLSFFTGFGLSVLETIDLRLGFSGIKPYAQARYRQPWTLSRNDLIEFRQTFFWRLSDRFGSTTVLSYEHALAADLAIRWLTGVTITQKTDAFDWSSVVGAYKTYGGQRLLSLELSTSGRLDSGVTVGEYGFQTKWQQPVYREWLLGEFQVGYFWPRPDVAFERVGRWALGFTATMRF